MVRSGGWGSPAPTADYMLHPARKQKSSRSLLAMAQNTVNLLFTPGQLKRSGQLKRGLLNIGLSLVKVLTMVAYHTI